MRFLTGLCLAIGSWPTLACGRTDAGGGENDFHPEQAAGVQVQGDTVFADSAATELIGLAVRVPAHRALGEWIETTGQVTADPATKAVLSAPAEGRIESISALPGDRVSRGQGLVRLSSPEYLAGSAVLRAPRSGVVTERLAELGQVAQSGTPLLEIAELDRVLLLVDVFPEMLARVRPGLRVEAALPGDSIPRSGSISSVEARVDSTTQAARARVPLANPDGSLRPGTFVKVRIQASGGVAVLVPAAAVVADSAGQWAFAPAGEGFVRRRVEARAAPGDSMAILAGVSPGEPLVIEGAYELYQARFTFKGLTTFGEEQEEE